MWGDAKRRRARTRSVPSEPRESAKLIRELSARSALVVSEPRAAPQCAAGGPGGAAAVFTRNACTFSRLSSSRQPSPAWRASGGRSARNDAED